MAPPVRRRPHARKGDVRVALPRLGCAVAAGPATLYLPPGSGGVDVL